MDDFELELKRDFLNESVDLLIDAESAFLALDKERNNPELLNKIFRVAHNLKGTSKAVGLDQLAELTHTAENLILKLKEGSLAVSDEAVTVLLVFKDKINEMIEGLKADLDAKFDIADIKAQIEAVCNGGGAAAPVLEAPVAIPHVEGKFEDIVVEQAPAGEDTGVSMSSDAIKTLLDVGQDPKELRESLIGSGVAAKVVDALFAEIGIQFPGQEQEVSMSSDAIKTLLDVGQDPKELRESLIGSGVSAKVVDGLFAEIGIKFAAPAAPVAAAPKPAPVAAAAPPAKPPAPPAAGRPRPAHLRVLELPGVAHAVRII